MPRNIILVLIIAVISIIFALQNTAKIHINLLYWTVKCPISLLFISIFFVGGLVGIIFSFPTIKRKNERIMDLNNSPKDKKEKKESK
jgi:uncharacterized integral membrane protein